MSPQPNTCRPLVLLLLLVASAGIAASAAHADPPAPLPLNPGISQACSDFKLGIDLLLVEFETFDLPDEGWVWVDVNQKLRRATGKVHNVRVADNDTPANHDSHDVDFAVRLDPGQEDLLTPKSGDQDGDGTPDSLSVEWEGGWNPNTDKTGDGTNPIFPKWAWPSEGDRIWLEGHWVYDCGHPDAGVYHSEIHPPRAVASMRNQAAPLPGTGTTPVPATLTDLYIHGRGGYMVQQLNCGMDIILGDHADTCGQDPPPADESYKTTPIAATYSFAVCLPPQPPNGAFSRRIEEGPRNTVAIAPLAEKVSAAGSPCIGDPQFDQSWMMQVTVPLEDSGAPPEAVYARRIYAGWVVPPDPVLPHRKLTLTTMDLHEDHDPDPGDGELTFMWMNLDRAPATWLRLSDHADGNMNDYDDDFLIGDGIMTFTGASFDFYLRHGQDYTVRTHGYDQDCLDFFYGHHFLSVLTYVICYNPANFEFGAGDRIAKVNASFGADDFGEDELPAGGQYELSVVVEDVPLANEDTADLSVATSCAAPGEVALVGEPLTCTTSVANTGPGLPRAVRVDDAFVGGTASASVNGGQWTVAAPFEVGTQPCAVAGVGTARCDLGTVPEGSSATALVQATPTAPGILVERVEAATTSHDPDLANNVATASLEVFQPVSIDVEPEDDSNEIQLNPDNKVKVAVLSTPDFDANTVDLATVCFGDAEAPADRACAERHHRMKDVDKDGDLDLLVDYVVSATGMDLGDTRACLKGRTQAGVGIFGCDAVAPR